MNVSEIRSESDCPFLQGLFTSSIPTLSSLSHFTQDIFSMCQHVLFCTKFLYFIMFNQICQLLVHIKILVSLTLRLLFLERFFDYQNGFQDCCGIVIVIDFPFIQIEQVFRKSSTHRLRLTKKLLFLSAFCNGFVCFLFAKLVLD